MGCVVSLVSVYVAPSTENGVAVSDFCCANISTCCVLSEVTPLELPLLLLLELPELLLLELLEPPELLLEVELPPPELLELLEAMGVE
jgi:hypothetical protein